MRASELVSELEALIEKHGDLIVANDEGQVITDVIKTHSPYRNYIELVFLAVGMFLKNKIKNREDA